jgi:tetratricopeptide (TPR) repeat protein
LNIRNSRWFVLAAALAVAACTTAPLPPAVTPQGDDRYLVDPRLGWTGTAAPAIERRFEEAWRFLLAGDYANARKRLDEIRSKYDYAPARLAEAMIAIREGRLDEADSIAAAALEQNPDYTAAFVYRAEVAYRRNDTRPALELYRQLAQRADAPATARERVTALDERLFNELYTSAQSAPNDEAIRLLREALTINAGASAPRILLVQKLIAGKSYDEARRTLDPVLNSAEVDRPEVQEALAEIDAGRGRYQEAIVRYDRLARRTKEPRYARRLEEIKEQWNAANQPAHVRRAMTTEALTRADFATLLYWNVTAVRFAANVAPPQIAIDIAEVEGREELVRAIAIGLYDVDPVTRRVSPYRHVTAGNLTRLASRVLTLRGATCARGQGDAAKVLAACGITELPGGDPEAFVTGATALKVLAQVDRALK